MNKDAIKLMMITAVAPVIADYIEDLVENQSLKRHIKYKFQNIASQIRLIDDILMKDADIEEMEQQLFIQRYFRQLTDKIYESSTLHSESEADMQKEESEESNSEGEMASNS